jgi:hypothetical protein
MQDFKTRFCAARVNIFMKRKTHLRRHKGAHLESESGKNKVVVRGLWIEIDDD